MRKETNVWIVIGVLAGIMILFSLTGGFNSEKDISLSPGDDSKQSLAEFECLQNGGTWMGEDCDYNPPVSCADPDNTLGSAYAGYTNLEFLFTSTTTKVTYQDGTTEDFADQCSNVGCNRVDGCVNEAGCTGRNTGGWGLFECPSGTSCSGGKCVSPEPEISCIDSDGGLNYYERGTATFNGILKDDVCDDDFDGMLFEYWCNGNDIDSAEYDCPNGCSDGRCVGGEYIIPIVHSNGNLGRCIETDGGLNYFQAGRTNISNTYNGQEYFSFSANDSCISEILTSVQNENFAWDFFINIGAIETSQRGDQNIVIETYCPSNGQVDFTSTFYATSYSCPNGCDNGACVN